MENNKKAKILRSNPNYVHRTIAGQHVLVSIGEGLADFRGYIQLNGTAAFLWEELQHGCTKEELFRTLLEKYDVEEDKARRDLEGFLELLASKGMISE